MGIFDWLKKENEKELVALDGPGEYWFDIVGESNYQRALGRIAGGKKEDGCEVEVEAFLECEDTNPHDNQAVVVKIDGSVVGYLDRKNARAYREMLAGVGYAGHPAVCAAIIVGGWDRGGGDEGHFGVKLDMPST